MMADSLCAHSGRWYRGDKSQFYSADLLSLNLGDADVCACGSGQGVRNRFPPKFMTRGAFWPLNAREQPLVVALLIQKQDVPLLNRERQDDSTLVIGCQFHQWDCPTSLGPSQDQNRVSYADTNIGDLL